MAKPQKETMSGQSYETQLARLEERQKAHEEDMAETKAAIAALQDERNKALKWGITTLGAAVIGMGVWIFNALTGGHIK